MNRIKKAFIHWLLGEYIAELSAINMVPQFTTGVQEYMEIMRDIARELKLIRATQS